MLEHANVKCSSGFGNIRYTPTLHYRFKNYKNVVHIVVPLDDNDLEDELGNTTCSPVATCGNEYILQIFHGGQLNFVLEKS